MKARFSFWFCLSIFCSSVSLSQVPQGFNYQAIAMDGASPITTPINVRITIQSGPSSGVIWVEDHALVDPDASGLINLVIGTGVRNSSSTVANFSDINWTVSPKYIKTEIDYGGWQTMGAAQLWSVPYAMVSKSAFSGVSNPFSMNGDTVLFSSSVGVGATNLHKARLAVKGDKVLTNTDPLFEVRRSDGKTVFAVYNEGIRMYVADRTAKGAKGGFAIGGFDVGGKADVQEYLTITPFETRINMKKPVTKGAKGGFAIGEFGAKDGVVPTSYMDVTPKNYFIGHESGTLINGGLYNSVVGYQAGKGLITGSSNTIFGNTAGINVSDGSNNILIGDAAGFSLTSGIHNTLIGSGAGYSHTTEQYNIMIGTSAGSFVNAGYPAGSYNTFLGINAGHQVRNSKENVFIGTNAGLWLDNGLGNTFVGIDAGRSRNESGEPWSYRGASVSADFNTLIGDKAGYYITNGDNNVAIGFQAGFNNADGNGNIFIGNFAGYNETGSNKLYIHNSYENSETALIYGEFDNALLRFNARTGIGKDAGIGNKLDVNGDINVSSGANYKINNTPVVFSQWTNISEGIQYNSSVGINAAPNAIQKLVVGGNVAISGNLSASGISASAFTGGLTGTVNGNVYGNVTGNVSGDVTGNITGKVNGFTMGKIFITASGTIVSIDAYHNWPMGYFNLKYDRDADIITIENTSFTNCTYWYQHQIGTSTNGSTGFILAKSTGTVIPKFVNENYSGLEIHFGYYCTNDGTKGYCSVWIQNVNGALVGHYTLYE